MNRATKRAKRSTHIGMVPAEGAPADNVVDLFASLGIEVERGETPSTEQRVDGERIVVEAEREIVIRCGQSSITLTRSGKIVLRGTHIVSKSSGANRVLGTTVRIN